MKDIEQAKNIKEELKKGNRRFAESLFSQLETGESLREYLADNGQHPIATVLACSDSRVNVEAIFSCGLGRLFVVQSAGNAILEGELSSIAYAIHHLHTPYLLVLGHTHCGAVDSVLKGANEPLLNPLLDKVRAGIANEIDPRKAEIENVKNTVAELDGIFGDDCVIEGALYDIRLGTVSFLSENRN